MLFLAGFFALLIISCNNSGEKAENGATGKKNTDTEPAEKTEVYSNEKYAFKAGVPAGMQILESKIGNRTPVINFYRSDSLVQPPLDIHEPPYISFISVLPDGYGTEPPSGKRVALADTSLLQNTETKFNAEKSYAYLLKDGTPWAYELRPDSLPDSWSKYGMIFAQIRHSELETKCLDKESGKEIPMKECDPMEGDRFIRSAQIDSQSRSEIRALLKSIQTGDHLRFKKALTELIKADQPLPNRDIESPLTVKGSAKGYWYFEGDFPVRLTDKDGNVLADTFATAQENWMSKGWVPFEATIEYESPGDERGFLILQRANPSGLPENAREMRIPVIFK